jgi:hypothetical protein
MTTKELVAAGLLAEPKVREPGTDQPAEDETSPAASGSGNRKDGEIRSEGEDIEDIDADLKDLVTAKRSKALPAAFVFGESKVTADLIREDEVAGFFRAGNGLDPLDEEIPTPETDEIVVFRDFFTYGLRFPCDPLLPASLDKFSVKIHQLSLNSFLEVSKFLCIMKTFICNFSADVFARFFELVIMPDVIKLNDGQYYEGHYTCCTFNTCRQNTRKGFTRIQIAPCCKTNFADDWRSYWFYVKVDMSTILDYDGPANPFSTPIEALTAISTASYNHQAVGIRNCESMFHLASTIVSGRDFIEEFVAANVWPISHGWAPIEIVSFNVNWATQEVPFPRFRLHLTDGQSAEDFMYEVEKTVNEMIGQYTRNEYKAYKNLVKHKRKINRVFSEICKEKSFPSRRLGPSVKMPCVVVASCSVVPLKALRKKSSKKSQGASSGVQPTKTKSLESTKRKRRTSEQISDVELQAASSLAQMSRKKVKKAVRKIFSSEVRRVPSAFDDDLFVEPSQKGFSLGLC